MFLDREGLGSQTLRAVHLVFESVAATPRIAAAILIGLPVGLLLFLLSCKLDLLLFLEPALFAGWAS